MAESVGTKIKAARIDNDVTAQRLADYLRIDISTVFRIEAGSVGCSIDRLKLIAKFFGVDPASLL